MEEKKNVLGYRSKNEITKRSIIIFACILIIGAMFFAVLIANMKGKTEDKIGGIIIDFALFALIFVAYLFFVKKQKKINSYTDESIYYEDGFICIEEAEVIKISCLDVKSVKVDGIIENDASAKNLSEELKNVGTVTIVTENNKKYSVVQIKDAANVKIKIEDLCVAFRVKTYNELKYKVLEQKIEQAKTNDDIKKIVVDDMIFVCDDNSQEYCTLLVVDDIKAQIQFYESVKEEQDVSIKTIKGIVKDFSKFYKKVLSNLADELIENANDWNMEDGEITKADFIKRIDKKQILISVTEEDYEIFFEDDDGIFGGHTIIYSGNSNSDNFSADIAG